MEQYITYAYDLAGLGYEYLLEISVVLLGLAGIAKLTKTKKDDKYVKKAQDAVNYVLGLIKKVNPIKKK